MFMLYNFFREVCFLTLKNDILDYTNTIGTPKEDFAFSPGRQEHMSTCGIRAQQHVTV